MDPFRREALRAELRDRRFEALLLGLGQRGVGDLGGTEVGHHTIEREARGNQLVEQIVQLLTGMNSLTRHAGVHLDVDVEAGASQPADLLRGPDDRDQLVVCDYLHVLRQEAAHHQDCGLVMESDASLSEGLAHLCAFCGRGDAKPGSTGAGKNL